MLLSPTQLRSLRVEALNWSSGIMCDELGWTGKNATTRLTDMEQDREPINLPTSKHATRIAAEHGYALHNSQWTRITAQEK